MYSEINATLRRIFSAIVVAAYTLGYGEQQGNERGCTMKAIRNTLGVLFVLLAITSPAVAGRQDFVLVNKVGFTIHQIFVSPASTDNWEEDVLGNRALPDNAQITVAFPVDASKCVWDLKAVDEQGETAEFASLNLCNISKIVLQIEENGEASAILVE